MVDQLLFLGFVISYVGIKVVDSKIQAITKWPQPRNLKELQSFHGLATFYKKIIRYFSSIASPLTDSMKKRDFIWGPAQQSRFDLLKYKLFSAPVLALPGLK